MDQPHSCAGVLQNSTQNSATHLPYAGFCSGTGVSNAVKNFVQCTKVFKAFETPRFSKQLPTRKTTWNTFESAFDIFFTLYEKCSPDSTASGRLNGGCGGRPSRTTSTRSWRKASWPQSPTPPPPMRCASPPTIPSSARVWLTHVFHLTDALSSD